MDIRPGPIAMVNYDTVKSLEQIKNKLAITTSYTAKYSDDYLLVDTTAGAVTITLPPARSGSIFVIMRTAGANNVTIVPTGAETVNGAASLVISASFTPVTLKDFKPVLTGYAKIA
jgi:hypothetical protein